MAKRTTTVYECDGCGNDVEKGSDLRRFTLEARKPSGAHIDAVHTELCASCEGAMLRNVEGFFPADAAARERLTRSV